MKEHVFGYGSFDWHETDVAEQIGPKLIFPKILLDPIFCFVAAASRKCIFPAVIAQAFPLLGNNFDSRWRCLVRIVGIVADVVVLSVSLSVVRERTVSCC